MAEKKSFLFSRYRKEVRYFYVPIFLSFAIPDYFYRPQFAKEWLSYRLFFAFYIFTSFWLMANYKVFRDKIRPVIYSSIFLSCGILTKMLVDTGGTSSILLPGLMLTGLSGVQLFRMHSRESFLVQLASYMPAMIYILSSHPGQKFSTELLQSTFLFSTALVAYIYKSSDDSVEFSNLKFQQILHQEVEKLRRTEALNRHFPRVIREAIEKNPHLMTKKRIMPTAVIGFADIVSSSAISNKFPLSIEWELKEKFLEAATLRAMEFEMVVLTHVGDGFLFIANFQEGSQWYYNLIQFYEKLIIDYENICKDLNLQFDTIISGLKFGISQGPVALGFLGQSQSYYTAIGPDVNLASRLCDKAQPNQIVMSSRVWNSLKPILVGWSHETKEYSNLKGFDYSVVAVHLAPRAFSVEHSEVVCALCDSKMSLVKTEDGLLDYRCGNGHSSPKMSSKVYKVG